MNTFRADIEAANDNGSRKRWRVIVIVLSAVLILGLGGYFKAKDYLFDGLPSLPTKSTMWELNLKPNSTLLDEEGNIIGHRGPHLGRPMKLTELPSHLPQAFLAIEDERFYDHAGIDRKAILRALFENTKSGEKVQGGSTLTQQLVKNMLLTPERSYKRKFQEMWLAYEMEEVLSKPEILELYLNRIPLGAQIFGVEAASQQYFGKSATEVNLSEAALLAALPKAPSRYEPTKNYDEAWKRAKLVLQNMHANNMITITQMSEAETNPPKMMETSQLALEPDLVGHFFDMANKRAKELVGSDHSDLIITTTLVPEYQLAAHKHLNKVLEKNGKNRKVSDGAVLLIDNQTGAIKTMVGGKDYDPNFFNRAIQAQRQPGSSFKVFVYAAALEQGFTPGTPRNDRRVVIGDDNWSPENYTKRYRGPMTIAEALKHSINTIAAQVGAEVGPSNVVKLAKRFGIKSDLKSTYSLSLGTSEVNLLELTGAYTVFANGGIKRRPYFITEIRNSSGEVLYKRKDITPERVYAKAYSDQMVEMMRETISSGTGRGAAIGNREVAGKTGTSQDYIDGWFIGFTSDYTAGVWMGNDDNSAMYKVTGGLLPADVWRDFMRDIHKGKTHKPLLVRSDDPEDAKSRQRMDYYAGLVQQLTEERNLAAGITVPTIGQPLEDLPQGPGIAGGN